MNRKLCLLFVDKTPTSEQLLVCLSQPHDLLSITGTTVLVIETQQDYNFLSENFGIQTTPCLIISYRNNPHTPQAFLTSQLILEWYNKLFTGLFVIKEPTKTPLKGQVKELAQLQKHSVNFTIEPLKNKPQMISVKDVLNNHKDPNESVSETKKPKLSFLPIKPN